MRLTQLGGLIAQFAGSGAPCYGHHAEPDRLPLVMYVLFGQTNAAEGSARGSLRWIATERL